MGRPVHRSNDYDQRWLPDPIPASFYARGEAPALPAWASPRALAIGAVALVGVVLAGAVIRLATDRPQAVAQQLTPSQVATPSTSPSDQQTPFVAAPTDTPTPTSTPSPSPTATPTQSPSPTAGSVRIVDPRIQTRPGRPVTLVALTAPRARCQILVGYTPAPQLDPMTASGQGAVSWTWQVSKQVQPGTYPIEVTCGGAAAGAQITVT